MEFARLIRDLFGMVRSRRSYWLIPILVVLLVVALLAVVTASSPLAPFIYPLF